MKLSFTIHPIFLALFLSASCQHTHKSQRHLAAEAPNDPEIEYYEFKPDTLTDIRIPGFQADYVFEVDSRKIVAGYYEPVDGLIVPPDTEDDFGDRLLMLDPNNKILFRSRGAADVYHFEPHFFKNDKNGKIVIICALAFEYFFGGDAYLFENGTIKSIGSIDLESNEMDKTMVSFVHIKEKQDQVVFTFDSDSLLLHPGSANEALIPNHNLRYIYQNDKFWLQR